MHIKIVFISKTAHRRAKRMKIWAQWGIVIIIIYEISIAPNPFQKCSKALYTLDELNITPLVKSQKLYVMSYFIKISLQLLLVTVQCLCIFDLIW